MHFTFIHPHALAIDEPERRAEIAADLLGLQRRFPGIVGVFDTDSEGIVVRSYVAEAALRMDRCLQALAWPEVRVAVLEINAGNLIAAAPRGIAAGDDSAKARFVQNASGDSCD